VGAGVGFSCGACDGGALPSAGGGVGLAPGLCPATAFRSIRERKSRVFFCSTPRFTVILLN
jgi:hypothetical protein